MLKDFKEFIAKGNVVDLAVGVIIGAAFGKIITSLVNDIIMPILSLITGKVDFANLFFALDGKQYITLAEAKAAGVATVNYGLFINEIFYFLIIAFTIFMIVKMIAKMKKKQEVLEESNLKICGFCKTEIPLDATRCPHCTAELEKQQ